MSLQFVMVVVVVVVVVDVVVVVVVVMVVVVVAVSKPGVKWRGECEVREGGKRQDVDATTPFNQTRFCNIFLHFKVSDSPNDPGRGSRDPAEIRYGGDIDHGVVVCEPPGAAGPLGPFTALPTPSNTYRNPET